MRRPGGCLDCQVEVANYIDFEESRGYSLSEIRNVIEEFEAEKGDDPEGTQKAAADEFLKACEKLWDELGWDAEADGANFLVSC